MRCLSTAFFTIIGLICLGTGLFLLYTVFVDTPETQSATVGGASTTAVDSVDAETRQAQNDQAAELDAIAPDARSAVFSNEIITSESEISLNSETASSAEAAASGTGAAGTSSLNGQGGFSGNFEQRVVELEWPEQFRTGEGGVVRVTLKMLPDGGIAVSSPEIGTNAILATPISIQNCHAEYDAFVTGEIIAPEFDIETADERRKLLAEGGEATWRWTLTSNAEGIYVITFALRMDWQAKPGVTPGVSVCNTLAANDYTFWGQSVQVETVRVLGLITIQQASLAGTVLAVVGMASQIPFTLELFAVLFERRVNRRADARRNRRAVKKRRRK